MATSGSYDFSVNRNEIIKQAMRDIRVLRAGAEPVSADVAEFSLVLNMMVKQWQGKADFAPGLKVFSRRRLTLFLAAGQQRYLIGPASGDSRATEAYGRTTLSADEAAAQTVLSITSNSDTTTDPGNTKTMANADLIGVELDDGTIHWSTISGTPAATATIGAALPSAASAGNYVYWFTARAQNPVDVESAVIRDENGIDTPLDVYREVQTYEANADKSADGTPTCILIERLRQNMAVTCDVQPNDVTKQIRLTVLYPAEDMDAGTDEFSFPQEWYAPLHWGLAKQIAPSCGTGLWTQEHQSNFDDAFAIARNANPETSDVFFEPGR